MVDDHSPLHASALVASQAARYLATNRRRILNLAEATVLARVARYRAAGRSVVRARLESLYDELVESVAASDACALVAYARAVARERFLSGNDLADVQAAFNACEEAVWSSVFEDGDFARYATVLPSATSMLGAAKDALGREYVALAARTSSSTLDLAAFSA